MGAGAGVSAVADSGPLIHLHEIGRLPLLGIFQSVHLTGAVWEETIEAGRAQEAALRSAASIRRHCLDPEETRHFVQTNNLSHLQPGELECLFLCMQVRMPLLLTDDLAARDAAKRLGVRPVGSLGVIIRACHVGRIALPEAEACLERLFQTSSLFVTRVLIDLAIEQLGQGWGDRGVTVRRSRNE
jgi:predicted nucleic acid-binding protein